MEVSFPKLGIELNIDRVAFSVFGFEIYWYAILIMTGFLLAVLYATRNAKRFDVKVASVNTLINRGKIVRRRMAAGKKPNWKKAYITLKAGQKIAEFEGV